MRKRIRRAWADKSGTSLVELVVTFALLALFCTGVLYVITSSMTVYNSAKGRAAAQTVSETLMEKICGEISGAQPGTKDEYSVTVLDADKTAAGDLDYDDQTCIAFCNKTGSSVYIALEENGQILIHYRPVDDNGRQLRAVDWTFDTAVYQGCVVDALNFTIMADAGGRTTNVIEVSMTLRNEKTGYTYETARYVECYNFDTVDAVSKITYDAIKEDASV